MSTHIYFLPYNLHYLHISAHLMFNVYIYTYLPFILSTHLDLHTSTIFHSYPYLPLISSHRHPFYDVLGHPCLFLDANFNWTEKAENIKTMRSSCHRYRIFNINTSCEFFRFLGTLVRASGEQ